MKKILFFAIVIAMSFAFVMSVQAQSRKDKKAAQKEAWEQEQQRKHEHDVLLLDSLKKVQMSRPRPFEEIALPCQEEAKSTDKYYGAWAVSDALPNQHYALQNAMQRAQFELSKQIGEDVGLENVEVVCRMMMRDSDGNYIEYVAIRMPKNK